jgi:hypothetical protein
MFEDKEGTKKMKTGIIIPLLLLPIPIYLKPELAIPALLITLNWDIYSILGKGVFPFSMINNFIGGALHFSLGLSAAEIDISRALSRPETFFFAFAMLCGSMHHDSYDAEEDQIRGFRTGAVVFSSDFWWKLSVFPMIISIFFLLKTEKLFAVLFFAAAVIPYFLGYFSVLFLSKTPSKILMFRFLCRGIFGSAALLYIFIKLNNFNF